jgi:hypothetical protein
MLVALTPRRLGVQDRLVLAGVQVTPLPLRLMIVLPARLAALRAQPLPHLAVIKVNVHLARFQLQLDSLHFPRRLDAQYAPIKLMILHPQIVAWLPPRPLQSPNSPIFKTCPLWTGKAISLARLV